MGLRPLKPLKHYTTTSIGHRQLKRRAFKEIQDV
jgi:hypothetical protein